MICLDEIRGRLAEVFSLKTYKIDHVVHGAIGSAAVYGAMLGATPEQIESAIGMVVAHYIPWRAIRAGKQLSDSKGASAALSTEVAILSMRRSMRGFVGPQDIFRNPEAIWRQFEPTSGDSPFDLVLTHSGDDFAVMGMHFKLGLYEHQSAGALQGLVDLISAHPTLLEHPDAIEEIRIVAYEPAFGIIGDPAKRDPQTRQSADHSMVYIVSTMLRKAIDLAATVGATSIADGNDAWWKALMLMPEDYGRDAIINSATRSLMGLIVFEHGGEEYDNRYPDGIPTSMVITTKVGESFDSGLVMYPSGHARNTTANLEDILNHKSDMLGRLAMDDPSSVIDRFNNIASLSVDAMRGIMDFNICQRSAID
jgi:2-methylcitrate dehydratase